MTLRAQFYTSRGYPSSSSYSLPLVGTNGTLHEILEMDAWGHVTQERRAGITALTTNRSYHPARGWIDTVVTGGGAVQNWDFDFDTNSNLTRRSRAGGALIETLTYDRLDRLTNVARSGSGVSPGTVSMTYDKLGNLCAKAGVAYTYGGADGCNSSGVGGRPHAVSQVGPVSYQQDGLGNTTLADSSANNADDLGFGYDAYEQVLLMARGNLASSVPAFDAEIAYGPDRARYRRIDRQNASVVRTTRYVGNVEFIIESGVTRTRRYLAGGAVVTTASNLPGQVEDRWVLTDHLGSSDVVVNDAGAVVESTGFDAWGLRRNAGNATVPGTALVTTTRGFTSHEHFDAIGLVHMNGRVYDPNLGRFIQSDPIDDRGIQGLNRYSYVLNNPLSLTDPTGHLSWGEWMRLGINIAITAATGDASGFAAYFAAGANGFMAGHLQSGTTKGGAWGAFSAITFHGIGSYFDGAEWAHQGQHVYGTHLNMGGFAAKVLAHSVTGGAVQHLQGGSFGSGFAAAGVTQAFSGAIDGINPAQPIGRFQRVMVAALVGGTASTISGGKFANGAVTAAFARAFNDEMQGNATGRPHPKFRTSQSTHGIDDAMLRDAFDYVAENNPASIREDLERGRVVTDAGNYDGKGNWVGGTVVFRDLGYTNPNAGPTAMVDASGRLVRLQYMVHTHGGPGRARDRFSEADMTLAYVARIPVFMSDYQGNL
ncbi:MAG: RHS repeat-associated core domain-containing protein [Pseudomonadota bacterium]